MANPILVTGAAGRVGAVGRTVTELLLKQGKAVRAMVRNEDERAQALRDMGAQVVIGDQPRCAVEQARQVRCRPPFRIFQGRPVAKANQGEELIQLAIAVDCERSTVQVVQRNRVFRDDRREDDTHATILT